MHAKHIPLINISTTYLIHFLVAYLISDAHIIIAYLIYDDYIILTCLIFSPIILVFILLLIACKPGWSGEKIFGWSVPPRQDVGFPLFSYLLVSLFSNNFT